MEKEEKQLIPEKFRASRDETDGAAFSVLQESDALQQKLAERLAETYKIDTPKARERAKASITIRALENTSIVKGLTPNQTEQLAEAYASVGFYDKARDLASDEARRAEYVKYWAAVWLDDSEWCDHPEHHKYIRERIWSVKENRETDLLACNACGIWNVLDAPERLLEAQKRRAGVRNQTRGMTFTEVKEFLTKSR